ncbi:MAG TPA: NDP-hexose 2,3-dehydratase family protein [Acidimicrobiia bacterium]
MTSRALTFHQTVDHYREVMRASGLADVDTSQAEAAVESMRDWSGFGDLAELRRWFLDQRATNPMQVRKVPISECRDWYVDDATGYVHHRSGEFFVVEAVEVAMSSTREVGSGGWCQPILSQVGDDGGILGLARKRFEGVPHYLVQAKAEPGNYGVVALSPSVQATFSNLKRAHGGQLPTFAWFFYPEVPERCREIVRAWLSEDGGRLYNKRNLGIVVELPDDEPVELTADFRWVSKWQIRQLFAEDAWVNPHLFRLISLLPS